MSICDEYRKRIRDTEERIRKIKDWPTVDIQQSARDREKIEDLERKLEDLKDKYERSLRKGGC